MSGPPVRNRSAPPRIASLLQAGLRADQVLALLRYRARGCWVHLQDLRELEQERMRQLRQRLRLEWMRLQYRRGLLTDWPEGERG